MYYHRESCSANLRITGLSKEGCLKIMDAIKECDVCVDMHIAHSNYATITIAELDDKPYDFKKAVEKANDIYHEKTLW